MKNFQEILQYFVDTYKGKKLSLIATGAGISLSQMGLIPGSSKVIHSIDIPYAEEYTRKIINSVTNLEEFSYVSSDVAFALVSYLMWQVHPAYENNDLQWVGVTGALTTSRWRKGENQVYVEMAGDVEKSIYIYVPKLTETEYKQLTKEQIKQRRKMEDEYVSQIILSHILNDETLIPMFEGHPYEIKIS